MFTGQYHYHADVPFSPPCEGGNWFSPHFAMQVYRYYLTLDSDRNGLLSKAELLQYGRPVRYMGGSEGRAHGGGEGESEGGAGGGGEGESEGGAGGFGTTTGLMLPVPSCALTSIFIDRVFEECCQLYAHICARQHIYAPQLCSTDASPNIADCRYDGEMDYKTFVDLQVHRQSPSQLDRDVSDRLLVCSARLR